MLSDNERQAAYMEERVKEGKNERKMKGVVTVRRLGRWLLFSEEMAWRNYRNFDLATRFSAVFQDPGLEFGISCFLPKPVVRRASLHLQRASIIN